MHEKISDALLCCVLGGAFTAGCAETEGTAEGGWPAEGAAVLRIQTGGGVFETEPENNAAARFYRSAACSSDPCAN